MAKVLFYGGMVCVSFVWQVYSSAVYIAVQTNVAPNALRASTIIAQYMANLLWTKFVTNPGLMFQ